MQPLGTSAPWWIHGCRCPLHERMPLLHLRELLSTLANHGDSDGAAYRLRRTLAPFYPR
jgi:hypothetical protein